MAYFLSWYTLYSTLQVQMKNERHFKTPEETRIIVVLSTMIYQKHCVMLALSTRPTFCHFQLLLKALKEGAIWYLRKEEEEKNAVLFCEMRCSSCTKSICVCLKVVLMWFNFDTVPGMQQRRRRSLFFFALSSAVHRWPQAVLMAYISSNVRLEPKSLLRPPLSW